MKTGRIVKDIMTKDCITLTPQNTIMDAAMQMKQKDIGFIPVVEGKRLIGVVTDRDLVIRGIAEKRPETSALNDVISKDVTTVPSSTTVDEASKMMARDQIRRLPVVDGGELVGVVAIGDMAVREIFVNEAGEALSEISESAKTLA